MAVLAGDGVVLVQDLVEDDDRRRRVEHEPCTAAGIVDQLDGAVDDGCENPGMIDEEVGPCGGEPAGRSTG